MFWRILLFGTAIISTSHCKNATKLDKCKNRPADFEIFDKKYFFNGYIKEISKPTDWYRAREACISYCADLMSINYEEEFIIMKDMMEQLDIDYYWIAGHICEKEECDKKSYPLNINGWRWVDTNERMPPTNAPPPGWSFNPWSQTGFRKVAQPDNAELAVTNKNESCLAVLNNVYHDGIKFHDVACYHPKNFICEYSR